MTTFARHYDPFAPDFERTAHQLYDWLRAEEPFHWAPRVREWIVTRYADVKTVLRDPALQPPDLRATLAARAEAAAVRLPALELLAKEALFLQSPPGHAVARRFLSRVITSRSLADSTPVVARLVEEAMEPLRRAGGGDFVADFARPVPYRFMGDLLGIPREDLPFVVECSEDVLSFLDRGVSIAGYVELNSRVALAADYLAALCRERRAAPREDGLTRVVELGKEDPKLDDRTLGIRAFFLFLAALDTTSTFLGAAMLALLREPEQRERWRAGDVAATSAVEELLRFTSPVALVIRRAVAEGEVCGHPVAAGQQVTAVLAAANRDPEVFADPHRLDLTREPCPHLGFGEGAHGCLGAALARLEGQLALGEFVRLGDLRLAAEPHLHRSDVLPRVAALRVEVR